MAAEKNALNNQLCQLRRSPPLRQAQGRLRQAEDELSHFLKDGRGGGLRKRLKAKGRRIKAKG